MKKISFCLLLGTFQIAGAAPLAEAGLLNADVDPLSPPAIAITARPENFMRIERAATQGEAEAQFQLALMYGGGIDVIKNLATTVLWLEKAARQGHVKAQSVLGASYLLGDGVPKNTLMAIPWLEKAAQQGDVAAQGNLGTVYLKGDGVPQNFDFARSWFEKAGMSGSAFAQQALGLMYLNGWGVKRDETIAAQWLSKAAAQNDPRSRQYLEALRKRSKEAAAASGRRSQAFKLPPPLVVTTQPTSAAPGAAKEEDAAVLNVIARWAEAWSSRDVNAYLSFYADNFQAPHGEKRSAWAARRRARIANKQRINVTVDAPQVDFIGNTAVVHFEQKYVSNNLIEADRKKIVLVMRASEWKIVKEISLISRRKTRP